MSVYILHESAPPDEVSDIVVEVKGLTAIPERTLDVQNTLAKTICRAIRRYLSSSEHPGFFPPVPLIECFIYTFDPEHQGFASDGTLHKPPKTPLRIT